MSDFTVRLYNSILQGSILIFTSILVYFSFVYYPQAVNFYKSVNVASKPLISPVVAQSNQFPIETNNYKITFEEASETYYVFVEGDNLDTFSINKQGAELALKNAISENSLCNTNIIYASSSNFKVPHRYLGSTGC